MSARREQADERPAKGSPIPLPPVLPAASIVVRPRGVVADLTARFARVAEPMPGTGVEALVVTAPGRPGPKP
jgi:hypothetical protein